jgi:hypothetical protein
MLPLNLYARVRVFLCTLHTRPRVQRAPGLPCALCSRGGQRSKQASGAMRREIAKSYSVVIARLKYTARGHGYDDSREAFES